MEWWDKLRNRIKKTVHYEKMDTWWRKQKYADMIRIYNENNDEKLEEIK